MPWVHTCDVDEADDEAAGEEEEAVGEDEEPDEEADEAEAAEAAVVLLFACRKPTPSPIPRPKARRAAMAMAMRAQKARADSRCAFDGDDAGIPASPPTGVCSKGFCPKSFCSCCGVCTMGSPSPSPLGRRTALPLDHTGGASTTSG